ncbi:MAG TPA: asparagine synthase-related protein [Thauera sp.]|nr:asparagine synthase-related protein [Thauera sp.]
MTTRRVLCGWVNFNERVASHDALQAMLGAEGLSLGDVQIQASETGVIACTQPAASSATDLGAGCAAIVLGRPRWPDAALAVRAQSDGQAAAVLAAWRDGGESVLQAMQGNFAMVLVDTRQRRVLLAIDRSGIERLCFALAGETLVFSTSARAVARHPLVAASISQQALYEYLYCHMVPSPDTAFVGVEKLLPAESITFTGDALTRRFYWQLAYDIDNASDEAALRQRFMDLTEQGVARQRDARAPTGAFLSGGTDSSTVSGMLGKVSGKPAETFSIGFDEEGFDELEFARITSRHFGTNPHEYYVTADDVVEAMPLIASAYDEPFGNASAAPTYFCAKMAREHGIEVVLAGDGGDEFFGGNERYAKQGVFERYHRVPSLLRNIMEPLVMKFPLGGAIMPLRKAQSYLQQARVPLPDRMETYNFLHRSPLLEIFEPEFLKVVDTERPLELAREAYFRCGSAEMIERMMHLDHKTTLADSDLRKVTRMCEAAGVEVRFPFLDDDLIAFSGQLKPEHKVHKGRLRVLFKDALRGFLPDETITKSKHGFGLPFGIWLNEHGPLKQLAEDALSSLGKRGIVRAGYLDYLRREHAAGHASYYGVMIWVLVELELWLQANT